MLLALDVADADEICLVVNDAAAAYRMIEQRADPYLAIRLTYPPGAAADVCVRINKACPGESGSPGVGWAGVGAFSTSTLLPAFRAAGFDQFVAVL